MRLGQTSVIHFLSKVLSSILGFAASIYIARFLGADILGIYSVTLAVLSWLALVGTMGITGGIRKRVSEQEESVEYAIAGIILMIVIFIFLSIIIFIFRGYLNEYIGFRASEYLIGMLAVVLGYNAVTELFKGLHMVHLSGVFSTIKTGSRAGLQIIAIFSGLGLSGVFGGYILGHFIAISLGSFIIIRSFKYKSRPRKKHFRSIFNYAKFAWLGTLRSTAFNWVDIVLLQFFVSSSFVGYYTAAWNIAQFLIIFSVSLSNTLFPEMSKISVKDDFAAVSGLLEEALSYTGLFLIPGLIGGGLLGEQILRIYGSDFTQANIVLTILIIATLLQAYQKQLTTTLNSIDRPNLAFRVNAMFISANVVLNLSLIYLFGWTGAAIATTASIGLSLILGYFYISKILQFSIPVVEISKQWFAAVLMGSVVFVGMRFESTHLEINHDFLVVLLLISAGAVVYFLVLSVVSDRFRSTVSDNSPI